VDERSKWSDGRTYYEYLLVYVDDIIIVSEIAGSILKQMKEPYTF